MDFLTAFLGRNGYLPHGLCFSWTPELLWSMVGADAVIATAYFSIPVAILSFVRKRNEPSTNGLAWLFSGFIFACGITHVMDIWTVWQPDYGAQAASKMITAAISLVTAVLIWPLIPKALKIPSVSELQRVIGSLEAEMQKRRSTEEHLYDTQQSLAVTLATIGAGFIATDRDGLVTRMNTVAERVTGWTQAEALGQSFWDVFVRTDRPASRRQKTVVEVMADEAVTVDTAHAFMAIARDGGRTSVEARAALTLGDDGAVRGMAMVFRDMTRLQQAEAATSRLAAIVESSSDAIIGKALDGRITSWNSAAESMFGYSASEIIGQPIQTLIPADRLDEEMRILANLAIGESVPAFDTVRLARNGRPLDVSVTISPIRDAQGRVVGASKIARDVTRQRRAEAALRDSEARLRFTLESAQIGDWDLDLVGGHANRSLRHDHCFGYSQRREDWSFEIFVQHLHHEDRAGVLHSFSVAVEHLADWETECRVTWPDGSPHWIRVHGSVQQHEGRATRMLGIVVDITDQKQAEEARLTAQRLEAENRQIQEANRLKSQFLANMSHELRTPLNAVIGFADLLQSGAVPAQSPKHGQFLGHIATSGRHLLQLINDVLDLSKVESGKFEFFPEPVRLPQLVDEVIDVLHTGLQRKQLHVATQIDLDVEHLVLDPARLKQVLYNYLSNAIKFTAPGGHVTVRAMAEGPAHFRLEVEDDGIGIAPHDLPRLFMEFAQLDAGYDKQHQGTGLGLSLTRRLVQAQGGRVGVRSLPGRGSTFFLVLARSHEAGAAEVEGGAIAAAPSGERVLVIEDGVAQQARIVEVLSQAGFRPDGVATGDQAVERAKDRPYRAMTLDLMLPDEPGLGVLARIRREGTSQRCSVVGVSMPGEDGAAAAFAIADVLSKPIQAEEIAQAMARLQLPTLRRARVMVIDDDPSALALMQATLQSLDIEAICVSDGRAALGSLEEHAPDAIALDLMMPGFDGFAVLDALSRLPRWRDTPVFIWTSLILTDEEYAMLSRSAHAIVSKGGGAFESMLESLRRWRPSTAALPGGDAV